MFGSGCFVFRRLRVQGEEGVRDARMTLAQSNLIDVSFEP